MAWTLQFYPYSKDETVGTLSAHFDDGQGVIFDYKGSVNTDDVGSVTDFKASARKELDAHKLVKPAPSANAVAAIEQDLNSK